MIEVNDLTRTYAATKAVDSVSFTINRGEIVGLLGLNGAGKTTVLKMIGCFLTPSGGDAKVQGYSVRENPEKVRELIGYLPDHPPLYNEMTVDGYLQFVARLKNVASSDLKSKVDAAMESTSLQVVSQKRLADLSHGFRQRVGIAQALVHQPPVVILDEPINGLDPVQIVEMRDLILSLKGKHTVILSSHILSEITKTCDRILVIDQGKLIAEGAEDSLQGSVRESMVLEVDVAGCDDSMVQGLSEISGVVSCKRRDSDGIASLVIETERDLRSDISNFLVNKGCGLLKLQKRDDGLESIFLKMVKN